MAYTTLYIGTHYKCLWIIRNCTVSCTITIDVQNETHIFHKQFAIQRRFQVQPIQMWFDDLFGMRGIVA